jgi:hypothetical protein
MAYGKGGSKKGGSATVRHSPFKDQFIKKGKGN